MNELTEHEKDIQASSTITGFIMGVFATVFLVFICLIIKHFT
jgi:hypothetical protein